VHILLLIYTISAPNFMLFLLLIPRDIGAISALDSMSFLLLILCHFRF
jgi:hypothetical protein